MEKRKIESAAELVNALELGVGVEELTYNLDNKTKEWIRKSSRIIVSTSTRYRVESSHFRYAEPVEVVELWGWKETRARWWDSKELENKFKPFTRKRTQIIQNGEIIWTKTEKI